ncbi:MAG: hypothetical protein ACYTFI_28040, partial [Planctomycetota bacterium]
MKIALSTAMVCCALGGWASAEPEKKKPIELRIKLTNTSPLLEGEPLHIRITVTNNMDVPFRYLSIREQGPPERIVFAVRDTGEPKAQRYSKATVGQVWLDERYVRQLPPGKSRDWDVVLPGYHWPELTAGRKYEISAKYRRASTDLGVQMLTVLSNPIHVVPSTAPVLFSWK